MFPRPRISGYESNHPVQPYPDSFLCPGLLSKYCSIELAQYPINRVFGGKFVFMSNNVRFCFLQVQIFRFIACNMPQLRQNPRKSDKSQVWLLYLDRWRGPELLLKVCIEYHENFKDKREYRLGVLPRTLSPTRTEKNVLVGCHVVL